MNFIRNIIAEKRSARPHVLPLAALHETDGHEAPDRVAQFNATFEATQKLVDLATQDRPYKGNLFAGEFEEIVESSNDSISFGTAERDLETLDMDFAQSALQDAPAPIAQMHTPVDHLAQSDENQVTTVKPRAAKSDVTKSGAAKPDFAQPDFSKPDFSKPGAAKPGAAKVDAARGDVAKSQEANSSDPDEERRLRMAMLADNAGAAAPNFAPDQKMPVAFQPDLNEMPFVSVQTRSRSEDVLTDAGIQVPPPAQGRGSSRSGRVKTRLLGFNPEAMGLSNPFEKDENRANDSFPVGWLVVVDGPGRGASFALHDGVSRIGRGEDQAICLNFGDNSISRENHVSVAYDGEQNAFYIGQSGRSNIVRLNNKPLLSTEQVRGGDHIRVGETTLRLAALCSEDFSWVAKS